MMQGHRKSSKLAMSHIKAYPQQYWDLFEESREHIINWVQEGIPKIEGLQSAQIGLSRALAYLCLRVTAPAWKPPQHVVQKAGDYAWISLAEADYAPIKKDCVSL